jgi:hypothetical protein
VAALVFHTAPTPTYFVSSWDSISSGRFPDADQLLQPLHATSSVFLTASLVTTSTISDAHDGNLTLSTGAFEKKITVVSNVYQHELSLPVEIIRSCLG